MSDPINLNIDINSIPTVECEKCRDIKFKQVFIIKKLSALTSPNGKPGMIPITTFACSNCGHINKEFLPSGIANLNAPAAGSDTPHADDNIQSSNLSLVE